MSSDAALIIPYLSKELDLIGHPALPFTLEKACKKNKSKGAEEECTIVFDTKIMIAALTTVCFELVKQIKTFGVDDNEEIDKLNFENARLEKQLRSSQLEIKKHISELTSLRSKNQQLQETVEALEKKIKDYKISLQSLKQKSNTKEDILKHELKRKETYTFNLHKAIWKQFNLADQNFFPENFKLVQLNQPDFNKLWSAVKHSETKTKEDALKKAVCIFQNNNKSLMEENFFLKTTLLTTLNEIQDTVNEFSDKLHISELVQPTIKISDIFVNIEGFDGQNYKKIINNLLKIIKKFLELFDEASFTVADDIFLCLSKIVEEFKFSFLHENKNV